MPAAKGSVWIGTFSKGVLRFHENDQRWFLAPGPGETPPINAIFENRHGEIHFGTPKGLYTSDSDSLVNFEPPQDFPSLDIRGMAEDSRGRLYLACNGQGLVRKTDPAWERFTTSDGLPGNHLWGLHVDAEDAVWLGLHGHALSRFKDGRFFNFSHAEIGLPRIITCIIEDDIGHLWFLSNQGLFRALRSQLNALADGRADTVDITHYTRADGMGSSQCTGNAWKDRDGKLWFTTMGGVTVVDPRSLPINLRPPAVVIEEVQLVMKNYAALGLKNHATPDNMREQLQEISESAMASIEEVRSIARALRPYQLDRFGLTKTLEDAADLVAKAGSLRIDTQIDSVDEAFAPDAQISIFRIVQEWLNNVVKHAQATTARLTVKKHADTVRMILEDDGGGFDYAAVMDRMGRNGIFGLTSLRERVRLLGGTLRIETTPGKGTRSTSTCH